LVDFVPAGKPPNLNEDVFANHSATTFITPDSGVNRLWGNRAGLWAAELVARIDELFAVDAEAREACMNDAARHVLRGARSRPLLEAMKKEMEAAKVAVLPASAPSKAVSYTLSLWDKLTRFLKHPELELSNNSAENSMRPVVLGGRTGFM
jgi:hypothetical protein